MKLSNPFKKNPPMETKSTVQMFDITDNAFLAQAFQGGTITDQKAFKLYRESSAVATAVDLIGDAFAQIEPVIEIDGKLIDSHPVLDLLNNPNGWGGWYDLALRLGKNYLLTNNAYPTAKGNTDFPPIQLFSIKSINLYEQQARDLHPLSYHVTDGDCVGNYKRDEVARQRVRFIDQRFMQELYHIMGFSSQSSELKADSPLQAASLEARQMISSRLHNAKLVENGGRLSLAVIFKDTLDADQHRERKELVNEQYGGPENAGKIGVYSGTDMELHELGMNNKDMDFKTLDNTAKLAVYGRYKVPLPLVTTEASSFNNVKTSIPLLYDWAVLPLADIIFSGLSQFILPRYGLDTSDVKITYDPESITALMERRLEELKLRKDIGIESTNELRESLSGRGPVNGGEDVLIPANMIPLGEVEETTTDDDVTAMENEIDA